MVRWFLQHGILPLYTPISGSWLNTAESLQRIIVHRALSGQHPQSAQQVNNWLEQTVTGWNRKPTPFVRNGSDGSANGLVCDALVGQGQLFYMATQLPTDLLVVSPLSY
jgi:hypothetical protein